MVEAGGVELCRVVDRIQLIDFSSLTNRTELTFRAQLERNWNTVSIRFIFAQHCLLLVRHAFYRKPTTVLYSLTRFHLLGQYSNSLLPVTAFPRAVTPFQYPHEFCSPEGTCE